MQLWEREQVGVKRGRIGRGRRETEGVVESGTAGGGVVRGRKGKPIPLPRCRVVVVGVVRGNSCVFFFPSRPLSSLSPQRHMLVSYAFLSLFPFFPPSWKKKLARVSILSVNSFHRE